MAHLNEEIITVAEHTIETDVPSAEHITETHVPSAELNTETHVPSEAHAKSFPPFDPSTFSAQLVWLILTFTILYLVLSRIAIPRIGEVLEERHDRIQRDLDKASELREDTQKAIATYEEALASARKKAHTIAEDTKAKLNAEINSERADIEDQITKKTEQAEASIQEAKTAAFAKVNEIAADTTTTIIEKLLGQKPSDSDVDSALRN